MPTIIPDNPRDLAEQAARRRASEIQFYVWLNIWGEVVYNGTLEQCNRWFETQSSTAHVSTLRKQKY